MKTQQKSQTRICKLTLAKSINEYIKQELWWRGVDPLDENVKQDVESALEIVSQEGSWTQTPEENQKQLILKFKNKE